MTPHRLHPGEVVEQAHCPVCGQPVLVDHREQIVAHYGVQGSWAGRTGPPDPVWCEGLEPDWRTVAFVGSVRIQHYGYRADALAAVEPGGRRRPEDPATAVVSSPRAAASSPATPD